MHGTDPDIGDKGYELDNLITAFEIPSITDLIHIHTFSRYLEASIIISLILAAVVFYLRIKHGYKNRYAYIFVVLLWFGTSFLWTYMNKMNKGFIEKYQNEAFYYILKSGKTKTVEGKVHVLREQPEGGDAPGDKVEIGGKTFELNYFHDAPGYNVTISHGGDLREGVFVRIHHYRGYILKIEMYEKDINPQKNAVDQYRVH